MQCFELIGDAPPRELEHLSADPIRGAAEHAVFARITVDFAVWQSVGPPRRRYGRIPSKG
jgi:hypothetical protein